MIAASWYSWAPRWQVGPEGVLWVAPHGSDWYSGRSRERPLRTIQRASDLAWPGCHVRILPGTYRERVHVRRGGTASAPVVFQAVQPGTVTLSWTWETGVPGEWVWRDEGDGVYSTNASFSVYRLNADGQTLYRVPHGGLSELRRLSSRQNAWGGFCQEDQRLYVALRHGRHPDQARLITHLPVPEPSEWGEAQSANVWLEADWIELVGLRFEFGIRAGVCIWRGHHVTVRDCAFTEARCGIEAARGPAPAEHLFVQRCLYHNFPQWHWRTGWLTWEEIYAAYDDSSLIRAYKDGTTVRDCLVVHFGDGLGLSTRDEPPKRGVLAEGNCLAFGTDDAIELDGPARGVTFRKNVVIDSYVSLGTSPVMGGPVVIENNLFLHPHLELNGAQVKLLSPWRGVSIRNVQIRDNVFWGNGLAWWTEKVAVSDVLVERNRFAVQHAQTPLWPKGVTERDNRYWIADRAGDCVPSIGQLLHRTPGDGEGDDCGVGPWADALLTRRPGPAWWDWAAHPATQPLTKSFLTVPPPASSDADQG